jgi:hypothetical protein
MVGRMKVARVQQIIMAQQFDRVETEVEALAGTTVDRFWYQTAALYALAFAVVKKAEKLPAEERQKLSERYASRAVEMLSKLASEPKYRPGLLEALQDPEAVFKLLAQREDYKKLLADLKKPKSP